MSVQIIAGVCMRQGTASPNISEEESVPKFAGETPALKGGDMNPLVGVVEPVFFRPAALRHGKKKHVPNYQQDILHRHRILYNIR